MSLSNTTPNPTDAFSRYMSNMFNEKQVIGVPTAFQAFFGNAANGSKTLFSPDANTVDIDIIRGNEKVAALIHRGQNARPLGNLQKNTNKEKFSNFTRKYPLAEEEGDILADQLLFRGAGESPTSGRTRLQRMRGLALDHNQEHIRRIVRRFEVLCRDSVLTGKHDALTGTTNTDFIYDFRRAAGNIITVANAWDSGSQTIMADLDEACDQGRAQGHVNLDMVIIGGGAMDAFLNDDDVKAKADNRRFELIEVSTNNPVPSKFMRFVDGGLTPRGRLRTPKGYELWMFTYTDVYTDESNNPIKYMPEDQALLAYSGARADRCFGPPENIPVDSVRRAMYMDLFGFSMDLPLIPPNIKSASAIVSPAMFYCDAYTSSDYKKVTIRTQAAPIFATTQTDAFVTLKDLI